MTTYKTAHMDAKLHEQITKEAARNNQTFSDQVKEYIDKAHFFEEQNTELKERINKIQDVA